MPSTSSCPYGPKCNIDSTMESTLSDTCSSTEMSSLLYTTSSTRAPKILNSNHESPLCRSVKEWWFLIYSFTPLVRLSLLRFPGWDGTFEGVTWLSSRSCAYCQGIRLILCLLSDILICSRSARSGDGEGGRIHYQHMWFIQKIQYSSQHGVSSQLGYLERIVIWWVSYPSLSLIFYSAADDPRPIQRHCWYCEGSLLSLKSYQVIWGYVRLYPRCCWVCLVFRAKTELFK